MAKTKHNELRDKREWRDLLESKKSWLVRKQEEEDAEKTLRNIGKLMDEMDEDDPSQ